jgi:hypothetical protein
MNGYSFEIWNCLCIFCFVVVTYRRTYADRSVESGNRVDETPYVLIKLTIIPKKKHVNISSGHETLNDQHATLTEQNENESNPLIMDKTVSKRISWY